ncbi:MAG: 4'-phosphopantetheinyl transferase superfamily protein [Opitutaceae bacterium]|nr:4'-phosphopantetheinyl transferase superfamily protein [Opitutaceae bacterium]
MSERLDAWRSAADWRNGDCAAIDVLWCALRCSEEQLAAKHSLLTSHERARAARFRRDADRAAYIIMRATLRERLAGWLGVTAMEVPLTEAAQGKPVLAMREPRWEFNVSHSGEAGLIAFAWDRAVGVDVEAHRANFDSPELGRSYFSSGECAALGRAPASERLRWFFTLWTRKEAFLKATGRGLSFPLDQFSVTAPPDEPPRLIEIEGETDSERYWRLWNIDVGPGFSATLAAAVSGDEVIAVRGWK